METNPNLTLTKDTMLCYKDKTFCASEVENHTCGRELSAKDKAEAVRIGLPIAYGKFCK